MKDFIVTGGAGFIGSHLVEGLLGKGYSVTVIDDFSSGRMENLSGLEGKLETIEGDVRDFRLLEEAVKGKTGVFHLAARPSVVRSIEDPVTCWDVNLMGTLSVAEAARKEGIKVVFAGSSSAYGDDPALPKREDHPARPLSPYAASKVAGENLLFSSAKALGLSSVILRFFNVFGPRQVYDSPYSGVIAKFCTRLLKGERPVIEGTGNQTRDFTYIANVVHGVILAMEREVPPGEVINIACGERISVLELFETLKGVIGSDIEPVYAEPRVGDVPHSQADISKARRILGYEPLVPFREGIEKTIDWYKEAL